MKPCREQNFIIQVVSGPIKEWSSVGSKNLMTPEDYNYLAIQVEKKWNLNIFRKD